MKRMLSAALVLALAVMAGCRGLVPPGASPTAIAPSPTVTVTIVRATLSAPNDAERRFSARSADLLARLLADSGIAVRGLTDDDVIRDGLRDPVALLAYNPLPSREERARFADFVGQGGKLIVFYSSDPALARLLGFELGAVCRAANEGPWSAFAFGRDRPALLPDRVFQTSRILRPAYPASGRARILAWWENADGALQKQPAWLLSDRGAWMSHVLMDGESSARRRLALGLVGHFDPGALRAAAGRAAARGGAAPPFASSDALFTAIRDGAAEAGIRQSLAPLEAARAGLTELYNRGEYARAIDEEEKLAARLAAAYARTLRPVGGEFRAVWNHSGLGLDAGGWSATARLLAEHGINAVFPNVGRAGVAIYPSRFLPQSEAGRAAGDPLAACCEAAREYGLAVHAWKICWNLEGAPPELASRFRAAGRLQVSDTGESLDWLCPSRPENVEWELAAIGEIAQRYPVQGVQLDYIRFPDRHACYCRACKAAFQAAENVRIRKWPAAVLTGPMAERYARWRAGQITRFVRLAARRLRETRPAAVLSAAVYGWYPGCADSLGQDWGEWLKRGYVSFVCPMDYTDDGVQFAGWLRAQTALPGADGRIVPGLGVTSTASRLNGLQTLDQIRSARRAGAAGFILFDLNRALEKEILPLLRLGATAD